MPESIQSSVVGLLVQDDNFEDWWQSQPVPVPFFDHMPLTVILSGATAPTASDLADLDDCLRNFLALGPADRLAASGLVWANYQEMVDAVGEEELDVSISAPAEVWAQVRPGDIHISWRDRRDQDVYLSIECGCGWEEEHGLQLVFRRGRMLTRVSQYDGHLTEADAYDRPDVTDALLSAYNTTFAFPKK
ncbi:DUF6985 domain-containing protein [Hymenobacter sp. 102]|uniref:DUF6985 domain-containing protein n=1 Tax=Hymenobacter sp. 102 TaxID=3403152 RepID=UPI003CF06D1C